MNPAAHVRCFLLALGFIGLCAAQASAIELKRLPEARRSCTAADMQGLRKLKGVYEKIEGPATEGFNAAPHQYMFFRANQTFAELTGSVNYPAPKAVNEALATQFKDDLRQYVLGENGALYLYQNKQVTDSFICQVVRENETPFRAGDMLFVLSHPDTKDMLVKVYTKYSFEPGTAPRSQARQQPRRKHASIMRAKSEKRKREVQKGLVRKNKQIRQRRPGGKPNPRNISPKYNQQPNYQPTGQ